MFQFCKRKAEKPQTMGKSKGPAFIFFPYDQQKIENWKPDEKPDPRPTGKFIRCVVSMLKQNAMGAC